MLTITYFVHGTTTDNENGISTGWNPGELSTLGIAQSKELAELLRGKASKYDVVFTSDLKRAVDSARFMFAPLHPASSNMNRRTTLQHFSNRDVTGFGENFQTDARLRECNYGDLNGGAEATVEPLCFKHIDTPFPNGESMKDVEKRMRNLCNELLKKYDGKHIAFVAHKAPQLALDVIANNKIWDEAMRDDWRKKTPKAWQPGWEYRILSA